jgi:hypothetical protein
MLFMAMLCALLVGTQAQGVNLIPNNADFDEDHAYGQSIPGWGTWLHHAYKDSASVEVIGWVGGDVIWQDTVHTVLPDTVYTLTGTVQTRDDAGGQGEGCILIIQDADNAYLDLVRTTFWFPDEYNGQTSPWLDYSVEIDSAVLTEVVGHKLCVAIALADDGRWDDYGNLYIERMNLVPEPMTFALLGLGGLVLRRRK